MTKSNLLPPLLENFFQHLLTERQLSSCTIASYRDSCRLLLNYLHDRLKRSPSQQRVEDWDASNILGFLDYLEKNRDCSVRSRNVRLAAIHCFMRFLSKRQPQLLGLAGRVLAIPNKRHLQPLLGYLTSEQVQAILEAPLLTTFSGQRDRLLFQLLYNTGARVSELVGLNREDLVPSNCQTVVLRGKGRKQRTVPLWPKTARQLRQWLDQLSTQDLTPVFPNRFGTRLTRFGVEKRLAAAARKAAQICPSLQGRKVSPHVFRQNAGLRNMPGGTDRFHLRLVWR